MVRPSVTVLLGDPRLPDRSKPGGRFTPDDLDQVVRLRAALSELEGDYAFAYWDDHERWIDDLRAHPPEFALNFCDTGFRNEARREAHVAALLEMLDVPYSGSGPAALGLCYDKALVRAMAQSQGIPVPEEALLGPTDPLPDVAYPAFVKPNRADGSVGIDAHSIVPDADAARARVEALRRAHPEAELLIQEYLPGDEYSVGIVGNPGSGFDVLPVLEVDYGSLDPSLPRLLDYGSKTDPDSPYWSLRFREAALAAADRARIEASCRRLFLRLELRDYARCDFRTDAAGRIKLLEVNPNPAWSWDGKLAHMAELRGERHSALLRHILLAARRRLGLA
jgi:D-alanine-D-alanine ligase